MKKFIILAFLVPLAYLLFGYTSDRTHGKEARNLPNQQKIVTEHPVIIQVETQGFPFDVAGNFPYIVMVDNVVYTFNKKDVAEFLEKGSYNNKGGGLGRVYSRARNSVN